MPLDFPTTPTDGQIFDRYKWNDTDTVWNLNLHEYIAVYEFEYLVIAGGASGGGGGTSAVTVVVAVVPVDTVHPFPESLLVVGLRLKLL